LAAGYTDIAAPGASTHFSTIELPDIITNEHAYMAARQWPLDEGMVLACLLIFKTFYPAANGTGYVKWN